MKHRSRYLRAAFAALSLALAGAANAADSAPGCACCAAPTPTAAAATGEASPPEGHTLRGVIIEVRAERQALLVKHEEIPGVMRAMTMLLKVDAPTLASAQKGQAITALLVRKDDGWWLEQVRPGETASAPLATK